MQWRDKFYPQSYLSVVSLVCCLTSGCSYESERTINTKMENTMSAKSSSRIPAPVVEPIVVDGIRYEQVKNGLMAGYEQMGGLLAAFNQDQQLWVIKVYENQRDPTREGDVQDVFFKSMTLEADGLHLRIENERGRVFRVNRETRQVKEL